MNASGGSREVAVRSTRAAGSNASRTSSAPSARSTTTATAGCSARCSTGRPGSSRAPASCRRARPRTTRCSSPAHICVDEIEPVGAPVALPRRDRRGARARSEGGRGVRLPLRRGRVVYERFHVHKTVFPADFLGDFGFRVVRSAGRVGLARLELGGLVPAGETVRERALRRREERLDARAASCSEAAVARGR